MKLRNISSQLCICFLLSFSIQCIDAQFSTILARRNNETVYLPALSSEFGSSPSDIGLSLILINLERTDGCNINSILEIKKELELDSVPESEYNFVALIPRGNCSFETKVRNAEKSGFKAVIIYSSTGTFASSDKLKTISPDMYEPPSKLSQFLGLIRMLSSAAEGRDEIPVTIPSVFITYESALILKQAMAIQKKHSNRSVYRVFIYGVTELKGNDGVTVIKVTSRRHFSINRFRRGNILNDIFILIMASSFMMSLCAMITLAISVYVRFMEFQGFLARQRANRLTKSELDKIPLKQIEVIISESRIDGTAEDITEIVCAICLDNISTGSKIRDFMCGHKFHSECVDSWLLTKHKTCPTCRQDVTRHPL